MEGEAAAEANSTDGSVNDESAVVEDTGVPADLLAPFNTDIPEQVEAGENDPNASNLEEDERHDEGDVVESNLQ